MIPAVFQLAIRGLLIAEAWRHGSRLEIGQVDGSFYKPVRLSDTAWSYRTEAGSFSRFTVEQGEAEFDWRALLPWRGGRWFRRLTLSGVSGRVEIPVEGPNLEANEVDKGEAAHGLPGGDLRVSAWWPPPAVIEAQRVDLSMATGANFVRMQDSRWTISEWEPGLVEAGLIEVREPWLARTFRNVRGTTAMQDSRVLIAGLQLDPEVQVQSLSADLSETAKGRLDFSIAAAAFGGSLSAEAITRPGHRRIEVEANGSFSKIGIAPLATFLGLSDAAGGVIDAGKFTFRGAPADLPHATGSVRFSARNFQWESRQWDSLVLGATLLERRIQVPEFELRQGQNNLSLTGEFAWPRAGVDWWKTEFNVNVAARLDNLTDLSALVLPEFKFAAGKASIDGSVRGKEQQFHGALIVSGSDLTWRSAPIKELHAAFKLNGNELQLANFDLLNRDDYVHGRGVINILGAKQYWGEVRASVEDLAVYAALLQKPLLPEPLAGGALVSWSGEGSAERYSGSFFARLQKLRSVGAAGARLHPVNAELAGAYQPREVQFTRFAVSDEASSFTAEVEVGPNTVALQKMRLQQGATLALAGDARLPLDVWSAWPGGDLAKLLVATVPLEFKLRADQLRLGDAVRLSGWNWPAEGTVSGELAGSGAGEKLEMSGGLTLRDGKFALGSSSVSVSDEAALKLNGAEVSFENITLAHRSDTCAVSGKIRFADLGRPAFDVTLTSPKWLVELLPDWEYPFGRAPGLMPVPRGLTIGAHLDLRVEGPWQNLAFTGNAELLSITAGFGQEVIVSASSKSLSGDPLDFRRVWAAPGGWLPPLFSWTTRPWSSARLDVKCTSEPSLRVADAAPAGWGDAESGKLQMDVHLLGTCSAPEPQGIIRLHDVGVQSAGFPLQLKEGSMTFRPGSPLDPTLDVTLEGTLDGFPFLASIVGPMSHRIAWVDSEEARRLLFEGLAPTVSSSPAGALEEAGSLDSFIFQGSRAVMQRIQPWPQGAPADPAPATAPEVAPAP